MVRRPLFWGIFPQPFQRGFSLGVYADTTPEDKGLFVVIHYYSENGLDKIGAVELLKTLTRAFGRSTSIKFSRRFYEH